MSRRDDRRDAAQMHIADMNLRYFRETQDSVATARLYKPGQASQMPVADARFEATAVEVVDSDTVSAVLAAPCLGVVAALDFASYRNPGGGYAGGSLAQEEAMCSESNLYNVLDQLRGRYYEPNKATINDNLYTDKSLYVNDVVFERGSVVRRADVIVCAAPNMGAALGNGRSVGECQEAMEERVRAVMSIAADNGVDHLVLGAFGCGVFKNDPGHVAGLFKTWLADYPGRFEKVVFAIPAGGANHEAFAEVFS